MFANSIIDETRQGEFVLLKNTLSSRDGIPVHSGKKLYIESYGCQMNFSDSEIVASVMAEAGFSITATIADADVVLINTCAIRDNAEQRIRKRLEEFNFLKKKKPGMTIGLLGCMAERLKTKLLEEEKIVDIIAGPDSYRHLPGLVKQVEDGHKAVNVLLSLEETYAEIAPVRLTGNGVTAFISIMRGCDNMCAFCVVPFTRGRERSRDPESIVAEAKTLFNQGYREVTLLGQNVDSYSWLGAGVKKERENRKIGERGKGRAGEFLNFAQLLESAAGINLELRIRFSTSHPKDMSDDVLHVMARHENICKYIHLPVQSGSSAVLDRMNRGYSREWYLERIGAIRNTIPDCGISTDIIAGFCGETEEEHRETVSLMEEVGYDFAYTFNYSERPGTLASRKYKDDIPEKEKTRRLQEIIDLQRKMSFANNKKAVGKVHRVLAEGVSKRSDNYLFGRNTQNAVVVFPKDNFKPGDYVNVMVTECTSATLIGTSD